MSRQAKVSIKAGIVLAFIFAGLVSVFAFGTSNPAVFGHSASEIDFTGMSGNVATSGDVSGSRVCIGTDCRTSWPAPTSTTIVNGADPNTNTNVNAVWTFTQSPVFSTNVKFSNPNEGIVFYGGGEAITGSADYGIDFKTSSGQVRFKINNDGRVEVFDRLCLGGDCKSSWPTGSFAAGAWCGRGQVGSNSLTTTVGPNLNCMGNDPAVSCPNGFTRVNYGTNSRQNDPTEYYWTCIKN